MWTRQDKTTSQMPRGTLSLLVLIEVRELQWHNETFGKGLQFVVVDGWCIDADQKKELG